MAMENMKQSVSSIITSFLSFIRHSTTSAVVSMGNGTVPRAFQATTLATPFLFSFTPCPYSQEQTAFHSVSSIHGHIKSLLAFSSSKRTWFLHRAIFCARVLSIRGVYGFRMAYRPGRRRGACSCIDQETGKAYIFRGYPGDRGTNPQTRAPVSEDLHLTVFDYTTHEWSKLGFDTSDQSIWPSSEAGASCTIIDGKLYHFGGWEVGDLNNDVYVLDLAMLVWRHLEPSITSNQPLAKNKCGLVPYSKTMLLVFGGYGYPRIGVGTQRNAQYDWERQILHGGYIGWTNEIHLFDLISRKWIVPVTTGVCPAPCAAFSFNRIDRHRVLLFGGRQKPERVNEVHILDMATWVSSDMHGGTAVVC